MGNRLSIRSNGYGTVIFTSEFLSKEKTFSKINLFPQCMCRVLFI